MGGRDRESLSSGYFKESVRAFFQFWRGPLAVLLSSFILLYLYAVVPPPGILLPPVGPKRGLLLVGSLMLIILPAVLQHSAVSRGIHKRLGVTPPYLSSAFLLTSLILLIFSQDILSLLPSSSFLMPPTTLIVIPFLAQASGRLLSFRSPRVHVHVPSKAKIMTSFKLRIKDDYYYQPSKKELEKGLPILVTNNRGEPIAVTHIRLELVHRPFLVPLSAMRRFGTLEPDRYVHSYLHHEYPLDEPIIIDPHQGVILYITKDKLDPFMRKAQERGNRFSQRVHPMYVTLIDAFQVQEWSSERLYYPLFTLYFYPSDLRDLRG